MNWTKTSDYAMRCENGYKVCKVKIQGAWKYCCFKPGEDWKFFASVEDFKTAKAICEGLHDQR